MIGRSKGLGVDLLQQRDGQLLSLYFQSSPYPILAFQQTPPDAPSAILRHFDLTKQPDFSNEEAQRCVGSRGFWDSLGTEGRGALAAAAENLWRIADRRGMGTVPSSSTGGKRRSEDDAGSMTDTVDVYQAVYLPEVGTKRRRLETKAMRWTLAVLPSPQTGLSMLVLTGLITAPIALDPPVVRPEAIRSSSIRSLGGHSTSSLTSEHTSKSESSDHRPTNLAGFRSNFYVGPNKPSSMDVTAESSYSAFGTPNESVVDVDTPMEDRNSSVDSVNDSRHIHMNAAQPSDFGGEEADEAFINRALARVAEQAPIGLVKANELGQIVWANPYWYRICGLQVGDQMSSWIENISEVQFNNVLQAVAAQMEHHQPMTVEFQWKTRGKGAGRWCDLSSEVQLNAEGEVVGFIAALSDCTARKTLEIKEMDHLKERERMAVVAVQESERKRMDLEEKAALKQQLDDATEEFAKMTRTSTVGLTISGLDGNISWANPAFYEMHDIQPDHDPASWPKIIHPDDIGMLTDAWNYARETMTPLKTRHRLLNGKVVLAHAVPSSTSSREGCFFVGSITDITQQVRSEEALTVLQEQRLAESKQLAEEAEARQKAAEQQQQHSELLVDFVSHETRNAISPILQSSAIVKQSLLELRRHLLNFRTQVEFPPELDVDIERMEDDLEALDAVTDSAYSQERVSNDILGLAQIQLNQLPVCPVPYNLQSHLKSIKRMFHAMSTAKDVKLAVDIGPSGALLGPGGMIKLDPNRVQQVIINTVSNAIRYTALGHVRLVTIKAELSLFPPASETAPIIAPPSSYIPLPDDSPIYLYIYVQDTGPGMTEHQQKQLFTKFTRTDSATTQSGLGLYIAKKLCDLQGGRIEVISTVGVGTTFRCYFAARTVAPVQPLGVQGAPSTGATVEVAKTCLRVLIADDNALTNKLLKRQLNVEGHDCDVRANGNEALIAIDEHEKQKKRYDAIILDVNMEVMGGLECVRRIREIERERDEGSPYRVVAITGHARPEQTREAIEAGMDDCLIKPYRIKELLAAIQPHPPADPDTVMAS